MEYRMAFGIAATALRRLRGLAGREGGAEALLLAPCRDVHTVGMSGAIDVAFVDEAGVVVAAHRDVAPRRRLRCRRAAAVIERRADDAAPWFATGDRLLLALRGEHGATERDGEEGR